MTDDPVARSDEFDQRLDRSSVVESLRNVGNTNRHLIRWLVASVAFDIALSVVVLLLAYFAHNTAASAERASTQSRINCIAANQAREVQKSLWNYVLTFPPPARETPADRRVRLQNTAKFRAYIKAQFAPRDCSKPLVANPAPLPSPRPTPTVSAPATRKRAFGQQPPTVVVTVQITRNQSGGSTPSPTPSSHSSSPTHSPSPTPSPSKSCLLPKHFPRPICLLGAQPTWDVSVPPIHVVVIGKRLVPEEESGCLPMASAAIRVCWETSRLPTPTRPSPVQAPGPSTSRSRVAISTPTSSLALLGATRRMQGI